MLMSIDKKYLLLPVGYHAVNKKLEFYMDGQLVYDLDVALDLISPDHVYYLDMEAFKGRKLEIHCPEIPDLKLKTADVLPREGGGEKYRPLVRFSSQQGWINDPNGLVYYQGYYHLFFQHNPAGRKWGNMHWGHAVSRDLFHWEEIGIALYPDQLGTMFSGSAIIDRHNVTGLKENDNDVILLFYTAAGGTSKLSERKKFTQCLAYSTDGGRTFKKYSGNPVISHIEADNRDPKVVYSQELKAYIMALYLNDNRYALFRSHNLLDWEMIQTMELPGDAECPDIYPLPEDGDKSKQKWVFSGAADLYLIGDMTEEGFRPLQGPKRLHYGKNSYAAQTFSDIPDDDGRRIRIAWNTTDIPHSCFNGSMNIPAEMSLKNIKGELYLCARPVAEIEKLYGETESYEYIKVQGEKYFSRKIRGRAFDIQLDIACESEAYFSISLLGMKMDCSLPEARLKMGDCSMPLWAHEGKIKLRFIVDTNGIEIFADQGQAYMAMGHICDYNLDRLEVKAEKGGLLLEKIKIAPLNLT